MSQISGRLLYVLVLHILGGIVIFCLYIFQFPLFHDRLSSPKMLQNKQTKKYKNTNKKEHSSVHCCLYQYIQFTYSAIYFLLQYIVKDNYGNCFAIYSRFYGEQAGYWNGCLHFCDSITLCVYNLIAVKNWDVGNVIGKLEMSLDYN